MVSKVPILNCLPLTSKTMKNGVLNLMKQCCIADEIRSNWKLEKRGKFCFLSPLLINNSTNVFTKFLEGTNQPKKIYMRNKILKILQCKTNRHKMEFTYFINKFLWNLLINTINVVSFTGIWESWICIEEFKKKKYLYWKINNRNAQYKNENIKNNTISSFQMKKIDRKDELQKILRINFLCVKEDT